MEDYLPLPFLLNRSLKLPPDRLFHNGWPDCLAHPLLRPGNKWCPWHTVQRLPLPHRILHRQNHGTLRYRYPLRSLHLWSFLPVSLPLQAGNPPSLPLAVPRFWSVSGFPPAHRLAARLPRWLPRYRDRSDGRYRKKPWSRFPLSGSLCNCLFRSLPMEKLLFPLHTRNSHIPVLQTLPVLSLLRSGK